jgi:hypothetical protein
MATVDLFRYAEDPYVNLGAAELARRLHANEFDMTITPHRIKIDADRADGVASRLREYILGDTGYITRTHRRTSDAHRVNAYLKHVHGIDSVANLDDERYIDPSRVPLGTDGQTVFADDSLSASNLDEQGIDMDTLPESFNEHNAYSLAPTYGGNPNSRGFDGALTRAERYVDVFEAVLTDSDAVDDDWNADPPCNACSGTAFPNWTADHEDYDNSNIEFGQSFTPTVTKSGRLSPMGSANSAKSYVRGRCLACVLAGFVYLFMSKPFSPTDDSGTYRWFAPIGDFERLVEYRERFTAATQADGEWSVDVPYSGTRDEGPDNPTIRMALFGTSRTHASGLQILAFYDELLSTFERSTGGLLDGSELEIPTAISSFVSTPRKSGNPIRGFSSFERINNGDWLVALLDSRTRDLPTNQTDVTNEDTETYRPFGDVLRWFASVDNPEQSDEVFIDAKNDFAYGLIDRDLGRLSRGVARLHKALSATPDAAPYPLSERRASHYLHSVLEAMTDLDLETIESISSVARNVGQTFADRENISVLMTFKNANDPTQFLNGLEHAGIDGLKMAQQAAGGSDNDADQRALQNVPYYEDVERLITALGENFEDTKHIFVAQAAISGQYIISNSASGFSSGSGSSSDSESGGSDAVEDE